LPAYEKKNVHKFAQSDLQLKKERSLLINQQLKIYQFDFLNIFRVADYIALDKNYKLEHFH
jgi:hypothetical protein